MDVRPKSWARLTGDSSPGPQTPSVSFLVLHSPLQCFPDAPMVSVSQIHVVCLFGNVLHV